MDRQNRSVVFNELTKQIDVLPKKKDGRIKRMDEWMDKIMKDVQNE